MRRVLAFVLVLGLAPGATGALLETALGAHCSHACCRGQDFCLRSSGAGHEHDADPATAVASHHGSHAAAAFALTAIEPPSSSCLETCGVLRDARRTGEAHLGLDPIETVQSAQPTPRPLVLVAESGILASAASPRGPPREHDSHPI